MEDFDSNIYDWCSICKAITLHEAMEIPNEDPLLICKNHDPMDALTPEELDEVSSLP